MLTDKELQTLRNMGNEAEAAADEIERLRSALLDIGGWDHRGWPVRREWDEADGPGAWERLTGEKISKDGRTERHAALTPAQRDRILCEREAS
jgi:hypothetical protein